MLEFVVAAESVALSAADNGQLIERLESVCKLSDSTADIGSVAGSCEHEGEIVGGEVCGLSEVLKSVIDLLEVDLDGLS